jgi:hypothetical protein
MILGNVSWQNWSRFGQVEIGVNSVNPRSLTVGAADEFMWSGDMSVNLYRGPLAGTVSGEYDNASFWRKSDPAGG